MEVEFKIAHIHMSNSSLKCRLVRNLVFPSCYKGIIGLAIDHRDSHKH